MNKTSNILSSKGFMMVVSMLGLFLVSTGTSWAIFSYLKSGPTSTFTSEDVSDARSRIDESLPKTQECPINGKMYSEPEEAIWKTRRPITAIIENHEDARPQSGLSRADIVYEAVAEGGITRFLGVFYCGASAMDVALAPIRSARVYFVNWASAYGERPLFVHIGGANNICNNCPGGTKSKKQVAPKVDAFALLTKIGWRYASGNDFDGGTNIGYPVIIRDQYRLSDTEKAAWEHSVVGFTDKIYDEAASRGFGNEEEGEPWDVNFQAWKFVDESPLSSPEATKIAFEFWSNKPNYDVRWEYDQPSNSYLRFNGGNKHLDHNTNEQLSTRNVVIMFVDEEDIVDEEGHTYIETVDSGDALFFMNGGVTEGSWKKKDRTSSIVFSDEKGKEIEFVRGEVWVEAVPQGNDIDY